MKKQDFDNPLRRQVFSLPDLAPVQLEACFGPSLRELMTMAEIFDARKIILTGCGDSYAAALAIAPLIEKYCDCFGVTVMTTVEFCRFLPREEIGIGEPNSPVVIAISASGGAARIVEVLRKANQVGAFSILLTNKPDSPAGREAKRVLPMNTPSFPEDSPGLRSYFASMAGLAAFASRMGHVRGVLPPTGPESWQKAILDYVESYRSTLPGIDDLLFSVAAQWKDFDRFDFVGDGVELGSALFGAAKIAECTGDIFTYTDSEEWCHINFFLKDPESIGTVFFADQYAASFGRAVESIASAHKIGRPVLVISNAPVSAFIEGINVCTLPENGPECPWLMPMMDFAPAALLAGYLAALKERPYFRMVKDANGEIDFSNPYWDPAVSTLKTSHIEIFA